MRSITADYITQIASNRVRPILLVSLEFSNETIYLWSGIGDMSWDSKTWKGVGTLGTISPIVETKETQAQGITLTLSGIPTNLVTDAMNNMKASGKAQVFLGFLDSNGLLIDLPISAYIGLMDQSSVEIGIETSTITIAVENKLAQLQRARGTLLTDQDQRARHPNDGGLKYVSQLADKQIVWGG